MEGSYNTAEQIKSAMAAVNILATSGWNVEFAGFYLGDGHVEFELPATRTTPAATVLMRAVPVPERTRFPVGHLIVSIKVADKMFEGPTLPLWATQMDIRADHFYRQLPTLAQ